MSCTSADVERSKRHYPQIRCIIAPYIIQVIPSSFEEDIREATDLIVLGTGNQSIAARVRTHSFAVRYPFDITFRSKLESGHKTEMQKICEGFGDLFFYGFEAADDPNKIDRWVLVDLKAWRAHYIRHLTHQVKKELSPYKIETDIDNSDGTLFTVFDLRTFPRDPRLVVASSFVIPHEPLNTVEPGIADAVNALF